MGSSEIIAFIREVFKEKDAFIPLHAPHFGGNEKKYVLDTIDSTFVSSVGAYVNRFEELMCEITGARYAIALTNGTIALQLAMELAGVRYGDEVISQSLTFVATANAIVHSNATPVFVDVDKDTMGLSPVALRRFLEAHATYKDGQCFNKTTGKRIAACVPMHSFGLPSRIYEIKTVCDAYGIPMIEDAAESLGSYYKGTHTGTTGLMGTFSFNGNKTVTCGGGGAIVTNDEAIARHAKHISTTAKVPHAWEFVHDEPAYNYRLPNLNAALACAQLEQLAAFVANKRELAAIYQQQFHSDELYAVPEITGGSANYWLNALVFADPARKLDFLQTSNAQQVMTRPIWRLMNKLPMYQHCQHDELANAIWLEERVVNIPSSVRSK